MRLPKLSCWMARAWDVVGAPIFLLGRLRAGLGCGWRRLQRPLGRAIPARKRLRLPPWHEGQPDQRALHQRGGGRARGRAQLQIGVDQHFQRLFQPAHAPGLGLANHPVARLEVHRRAGAGDALGRAFGIASRKMQGAEMPGGVDAKPHRLHGR